MGTEYSGQAEGGFRVLHRSGKRKGACYLMCAVARSTVSNYKGYRAVNGLEG